ncbi:hypothetical protein [Trinickia symbiotica]|uniref:hypothetical protein n=1 Tax=Trinickia symbiotica TaxID=863227 RepID=UPI0011B1FB15|nr:hypothetical protein [Trinickia symbiotica]
MGNILRCGPVWAAGLLCAACAGAQTYDGSNVDNSYIDTSRCQIVSGQTQIEGTMQPFVGRACLQSNGIWVFVSEYGSWVAPADGYTYYPSPWWYAESPYFFGSTVVFVDRFHRFHHFHHFDHDFDHGFGRHFHEWNHMPAASSRPSGIHSWGGGMHAWGGGGMRRN